MRYITKVLSIITVSLGLSSQVTAMDVKDDIVDTAIGAGSFETLVAAVKAADLVEALKADGPYTVFAPSDAAFAKIDSAALTRLIQDKDALTKVLAKHVVTKALFAEDVLMIDGVTTLGGQYLSIAQRDGKVFVNGSEVISTDIETSNGIIHVIDSVILN